MTIAPFAAAPLYIQIHAACAILALFLGPFVILRNRRDRLHKTMGYIWVLAMACTALSSFWIQEFRVIGPFSPIHGLSCIALYALYCGVTFAIKGNISAHRTTFRALYMQALVLAGLFTLLPGRIMNRVLFAQNPETGIFILAFGLITLGVIFTRRFMLRRAAKV